MQRPYARGVHRKEVRSQIEHIGATERRDLAQRMEEFLSSELHTYVCQICYELMTPPERSPFMLFPCGHCFCKVRPYETWVVSRSPGWLMQGLLHDRPA
jgi:hypothetical protein